MFQGLTAEGHSDPDRVFRPDLAGCSPDRQLAEKRRAVVGIRAHRVCDGRTSIWWVGVIAPILGVLIIRRDLSKEAMVGTLGFFGFLGNLLKIAGFTLIGFSFAEFGPLMACMIPAAIIGTRVGRAVLSKMDDTYFLIAFRIVLLLLAIKLIAVDGLGLLG